MPVSGGFTEIVQQSAGSGMATYQSGSVVGALVRVFQQIEEVGEGNLLGRWRLLYLGKKIIRGLL